MAQTVKLMLPNSTSHLICSKVLHWFQYNRLHICVGRLELSNLCAKLIISLQKKISVELISSKIALLIVMTPVQEYDQEVLAQLNQKVI